MILQGNLAPDGAVVKQSAVAPEMLRSRSPARVFNSEDEAMRRHLRRSIKPGDVVVIRYEGREGRPGMPRNAQPDLRHLRHGA